MNINKPLSKKTDIVVQELPNELLIYNLSTDRAFCLNETAAFVWRQADGKNTVADIKKMMERQFRTGVDDALIRLALDQLGREELLEVKPEHEYSDITRRQAMRQIGLGSLIALPVIATLTSPVYAASCPVSGAVTPTQCSSNNPGCNGFTCTGSSSKAPCPKSGCVCTSGTCA